MRRAMAVLVGRILILLAFWPVPAWAGQLHVQDLLLRDIGVAALVQVVSATAERLRVLVKRVFVAPGANRDRLGPLAQEGATASDRQDRASLRPGRAGALPARQFPCAARRGLGR